MCYGVEILWFMKIISYGPKSIKWMLIVRYGLFVCLSRLNRQITELDNLIPGFAIPLFGQNSYGVITVNASIICYLTLIKITEIKVIPTLFCPRPWSTRSLRVVHFQNIHNSIQIFQFNDLTYPLESPLVLTNNYLYKYLAYNQL